MKNRSTQIIEEHTEDIAEAVKEMISDMLANGGTEGSVLLVSNALAWVKPGDDGTLSQTAIGNVVEVSGDKVSIDLTPEEGKKMRVVKFDVRKLLDVLNYEQAWK
jgi:hypothetical protein